MYYHYSQMDSRIMNPAGLLPYKDTLLLIANEGFISVLDITKFPPLLNDFIPNGVPMPQSESMLKGSFGNNSVCAAQPHESNAPLGLSFISMKQETVAAKTLSYSAATSTGLALTALLASASILAF